MLRRLTLMVSILVALSLNVTAFACVNHIISAQDEIFVELSQEKCPGSKNKYPIREPITDYVTTFNCDLPAQTSANIDLLWVQSSVIRPKHHLVSLNFFSNIQELEKRPPKA
jgi:hypothetical protein